jgi:hypothetical protein
VIKTIKKEIKLSFPFCGGEMWSADREFYFSILKTAEAYSGKG